MQPNLLCVYPSALKFMAGTHVTVVSQSPMLCPVPSVCPVLWKPELEFSKIHLSLKFCLKYCDYLRILT